MFLYRRRRAYKKCTKKFTKCGMYNYLTKKMKINRERYASFQKILHARVQTWSKQVEKGSGVALVLLAKGSCVRASRLGASRPGQAAVLLACC